VQDLKSRLNVPLFLLNSVCLSSDYSKTLRYYEATSTFRYDTIDLSPREIFTRAAIIRIMSFKLDTLVGKAISAISSRETNRAADAIIRAT